MEIGLAQLFSDIKVLRSESIKINILGEWRESVATEHLTDCLIEFKKELNEYEQKIHVFIPTNLSHAGNWNTSEAFNFRFIQVDSIQSYSNQIPEKIQGLISKLKESFSHVIYTETQHRNRDIL